MTIVSPNDTNTFRFRRRMNSSFWKHDIIHYLYYQVNYWMQFLYHLQEEGIWRKKYTILFMEKIFLLCIVILHTGSKNDNVKNVMTYQWKSVRYTYNHELISCSINTIYLAFYIWIAYDQMITDRNAPITMEWVIYRKNVLLKNYLNDPKNNQDFQY